MNWDAVSFDWNHVRAFLATVEHGSFSGAARALRQTQPTLSRQISGLEEALQVTLFERGTRVMQLTESGVELLEHVRTMADAAVQISRVAAGQSQAVEGTVRITCSDAMAAHALPKLLVALCDDHPGIAIELVPSNAVSDLTRRDADIAIRHSEPDQPDLIAKRLPDIDVSLFATGSYLDSLGPIVTPADLAAARFIGFEDPERMIPQLQQLGIPVTRRNFVISTNTGSALYELARDGAGIAFLPVAAARGKLGLRPVLPEFPSFGVPTWLVTHREIHTSRRIRLAFDHLATHLGRDGWFGLVDQS